MFLGSIVQWWANLKHIGGSAHKPLWSRSLTQWQKTDDRACTEACQPWQERAVIMVGRQHSPRYAPRLLIGAVLSFNKKKKKKLTTIKEKISRKYAIQVNNHPSPSHKLPLQSYLVEPVLMLLSNLQLQRALAKPGSNNNIAITAHCSSVTEQPSSAAVHRPVCW